LRVCVFSRSALKFISFFQGMKQIFHIRGSLSHLGPLEQVLLGALWEKGSATVRELFGDAIRFGKNEVFHCDKYVKEPAGWRVILNKLLLM